MTATPGTTPRPTPTVARGLGLRAKLWGAFAVLIAAMLSLGAFDLVSSRRAQDVVREIVDDRGARARTAHEAASLVNANLASRLTLFLVPDSAARAALLAEQAGQSARITSYFDRIGGALESGEERTLFDAIRQRRAAYLEAFTGARTLLLAGRRDEAAAVVTARVLPRAGEYLAAWVAFDDFQNRRVDAAAARGRSAYENGRRGALVVLALTTLLAVLFAGLVSRSIRRPIADLQAAAQRIADGDLAHTLDYHGDDELGSLADAFRRMASSLQGVLGTIDAAASRLSATASDVAASSEELTASADEVALAAQTLAVAERREAAASIVPSRRPRSTRWPRPPRRRPNGPVRCRRRPRCWSGPRRPPAVRRRAGPMPPARR
jgi:methyl-accepting chemotaxis protein